MAEPGPGPSRPLADVAVIVVSTNEGHWLERCLGTVYERAGDADLQVIVVENDCTDDTREIVERDFPEAELVHSQNHGFAYGNNRGLERAHARYLLLLNPDTEILDGTFSELLRVLDSQPHVGLAGVRQSTADGTLWPTIRRFPSLSRALGDALFSERWPVHPSWAGERVVEPGAYEREFRCDWTSGSFMLVRREALLAAGLLDERFFIYSEEPDLCRRITRAGWEVRHLPQMSILHHAGKGGIRPKMLAQDAYARKQYADKHFGPLYRRLYLLALETRHVLRGLTAGFHRRDRDDRRDASRSALATLRGQTAPPFGVPPDVAVRTVPPGGERESEPAAR